MDKENSEINTKESFIMGLMIGIVIAFIFMIFLNVNFKKKMDVRAVECGYAEYVGGIVEYIDTTSDYVINNRGRIDRMLSKIK